MTSASTSPQEINHPFTGVAAADVSRMRRIVRSGGEERQ